MAHTISPPSLDELTQCFPAFCRRHSIVRVEVFGSVATGEALPGSDVDLMVTFLPGVEPGLEFFSMQDELEEILGCSVDLLTRRSVERSDNAIRRGSILKSARARLMQVRQAGYLLDILRSAEAIQSYVAGHDRDDFLGDRKTQDAVLRRLLVIGEMAARLTAETDIYRLRTPVAMKTFDAAKAAVEGPATRLPALPCSARSRFPIRWAGMRNRVVHDCLSC